MSGLQWVYLFAALVAILLYVAIVVALIGEDDTDGP